jgi:hypothetical protein
MALRQPALQQLGHRERLRGPPTWRGRFALLVSAAASWRHVTASGPPEPAGRRTFRTVVGQRAGREVLANCHGSNPSDVAWRQYRVSNPPCPAARSRTSLPPATARVSGWSPHRRLPAPRVSDAGGSPCPQKEPRASRTRSGARGGHRDALERFGDAVLGYHDVECSGPLAASGIKGGTQ